MTADTGTVWARGVSEPANDPLSAAVPLGAAALFGGYFADQSTYTVVNAGRAWYCIPFNTKVIHRNS
jgi:hypothetical protein